MDLNCTQRNISLALLTYNRLDFVKRVIVPNIESAGIDITEIIWCDNGSTDGTVEYIESVVS